MDSWTLCYQVFFSGKARMSLVLVNLTNYNKRKQFNEPIKIGNVDTVSEVKARGKKLRAASF